MKYTEALLRKHAVFVVSPYIKDIKVAYRAWTLEGDKPINNSLMKRFLEQKAKDIISRKELEYRKGLDILWQKDFR